MLNFFYHRISFLFVTYVFIILIILTIFVITTYVTNVIVASSGKYPSGVHQEKVWWPQNSDLLGCPLPPPLHLHKDLGQWWQWLRWQCCTKGDQCRVIVFWGYVWFSEKNI